MHSLHVLILALVAGFPAIGLASQAVGTGSVDGIAGEPARVATGELTMLKLKSGAIHWVRIAGHDPEVLHILRVDTGGRVALPWTTLDPGQERELRLRFGYVDVTDDEIMIEADRLVLIGGQEIIGKILQRTDDAILVKTTNSIIPVPKRRIAAASTVVSVPALDIYTREELYQFERAKIDETDPAAHFDLAQRAERFLDYEHAFEHYKVAQVLDPGFRTDDLAVALVRSERKAAAQEQVDALQAIEQLRRRKLYDKASLAIMAFRELYPDTSLSEDLRKKEQRLERSREKDLQTLVERRWHFWAARLARQAAREKGYEETIEYATEAMTEDIVARVQKDAQRFAAEIEEDLVRQFWNTREGGRWRSASYGNGTWLLGDGEARKGLDPEPEAGAKKTGGGQLDKERAKLAEKLARYMRHQQMVARARASEDESENYEAFWLGYPSRYQWVLAYYAEHSGVMHIHPKPRFQACRECGGEGVQRVLSMAGTVGKSSGGGGRGETFVDCPLCHRVGIVRRIHYR